jgi:hypothetical protein
MQADEAEDRNLSHEIEFEGDLQALPEEQAFMDYARLDQQRRGLKDELEEIEDKMEALEPRLLTAFEHGLESVRVLGITIFRRREIWARPNKESTRQMVCDALKASDLGHYVHDEFNVQSLSRWVRDIEQAHQDELLSENTKLNQLLPPALASVLNVDPTLRISTRKGK